MSQENADRRRLRRKVLGSIALAAAFTIVALPVSLHIGITRRWDAQEREVMEMLACVNERNPFRSPHAAATLPGNAWEDYAGLGKSLPKWSRDELELLQLYHDRNAQAAPTKALALLAAATSFTDLVSRGARRKECRYPYPEADRRWLQLPQEEFQQVAFQAGVILGSRARALVDEGKPREAVDILLDLAVFGRDLADRSFGTDPMDGLAAVTVAVNDLERILASGTLRKEDLLHLDRRLAALDADWPDHEIALRSDLMEVGMLLIREDRAKDSQYHIGGWPRIRSHWRTFYSTRLRAVETFKAIQDRLQRVIAANRLPVEDADPILRALKREMRESEDPLWLSCHNVGRCRQVRSEHGQLRLLRLAVHSLATGETLNLEDPLGGMLRLAETEDALRAWREGSSGNVVPVIVLPRVRR